MFTDRLFWVWLSKIWTGWREALIIVKPETVIAWHRQAFRFYWRWLSRRKIIGRPTVSAEVRNVDQTDGPGQSAVALAAPVKVPRRRDLFIRAFLHILQEPGYAYCEQE